MQVLNREHVTVKLIERKFVYHPKSGTLTPKVSSASVYLSNGYQTVYIEGVTIMVSHIVWLYETGEWPKHNLVYKDGNRLNNHISNLEYRKVKGIYEHRGKFKVVVGGKYRGLFETLEEAEECRELALKLTQKKRLLLGQKK